MSDIPKIIHHIWLGAPMSDRLAGYVATWPRLHPGWEHKIWTDEDLDWLSLRSWFDMAPDLVGPKEVGQLRADIARLEILWRYGGVYVDCDMEAVQPIDDLCEGVSGFAGFEDPECQWINNAVVGAERESSFIGYLIDALPDRLVACKRRKLRRPNMMTGPQWVTPLWREHGSGIEAYPYWYFYPYAHNELDRGEESFPDSYAIHHWNHQRIIHGKEKI